ncbi:helix-turn-helix domain-containing protein [Mycolicibacterium llatzerense]|uniref:helix-turn-helix domain-containing protein n=1 Tax=Mycolicibacterium llatzerense TaxID=280871 RepID=UPI000AD43EE3|nr:helix-turn-helix transcriptional regulator [Mycolicibacterium llatzerense]
MQAVSEKIARLFEVMHRRDEPAMSPEAAAAGIVERTGVVIDSAYLGQLRSGAESAPSLAELMAIAKFFGVSPEYLTEDRPDIEDQLTLLEMMRDGPRVFECRRLG